MANPVAENADVDEPGLDEPEEGKAAPTPVGAAAGGTAFGAAGSPGTCRPGIRSST
jgi:hypothetical protein